MKTIKYIFIACLLIFGSNIYCQNTWVPFTSPTPQAADVSLIESDNVSVEFSVEVFGMYQTDILESGIDFQRISTPGGSVLEVVGQPEMPLIRQLIAIPHCTDVTLSVNVTGTTSFSNYYIYPAPELVEVTNPDGSISLEESFVYDQTAYQQNQNYPQITAEIASTGYLRDQMYAEVFIYPIQFNPVTGNLQVNTNYELTLTFTNPSGPINENTGIFNNVASNVFLNYVSSGITAEINDRPGHTGDIEWIELTQQSQASDIIADYLIITDDMFWDISGQTTDLLKIAQHRAEYNGFDIAIVKVEDVLDVFNIDGEPYEYERAIRRFIRAVYDDGSANNTYDGKLGYVLLVGGAIGTSANYIPAATESHPELGTAVANDYFYTCITEDGQQNYDRTGDLFIGRFSVYNQTGLSNNIHKTMYFENEKDLNGWKENIGFTRQVQGDYIPNVNLMYQNLDNYINEPYNMLLFDTDNVPLGSQTELFLDEFDQGRLFMSYFGHSAANKYVYDEQYQTMCTDVYMMNNLQNVRMTPFVINYSCYSGQYNNTDPCLAENLTNYSETNGYLSCLASTRLMPIGYLKTNAPQNPPNRIVEGRIPYSIWHNFSHITGEFILESKIVTNDACERWFLNYFGDPALNLMAEGFEVTQDVTIECGTEISSEIIVREGAKLTIPGCSLNFVDNGRIIIDYGATLKIYPQAVISGMNSNNAIDVYGNLEIPANKSDGIIFTSPAGHTWRGLSVSNLSIDVPITVPLTFQNCDFVCHANSLSLQPTAGRGVFNNASLTFSHGSMVMNNTDFTNSSVLVLDPNSPLSSVEISYCEFNNESNVFLSSIFIERYKQYGIHDNDIEFSDGDGITIFNCGGITDNNFPNGITNNRIEYTGSSPNLHKGIKVYRGKANISLNKIMNADYGIVGMNNSLITIIGDETAQSPGETQQIVYNDSYQLYFSNNSFPQEISYNIIGNGDDIDPLVYNDANPPLGTLFDVTLNCWDNHFSASNDLIPANQYDWIPPWCPTTKKSLSGAKDIGDDELIYASAVQNIENGNYLAAQSEFKEIISDYSDTETAKSAVKQLFDLEPVLSNDYHVLITYFEAEPNLQNNNQLGKLSDWMISYCNVELGEYQLAIDWYDNVIDTTNSEADSTFAAIDMGEAALAMGNATKGSVQCKHSQFIFDNHKAFGINREYLINELLKSQKNNEQNDPGLGEDNENRIAILHQNTPNPFSSTTTIKVELYKACYIELVIVDIYGKEVATLAKGYFNQNLHSFVMNEMLSEGIYFSTLIVNGILYDSKKIVLIK